jgi:hypothetical protein
MVPASLTRSARPARDVTPLGRIGRGRQPNIYQAALAELRAMVAWGALLGGLGVVILLGSVWVRLKVIEAGYRLSATRQLVERLETEGRELAVRAAAADAPDQLAALAQQRLGMHPPGPGQEVFLP